MLWNDERYEAAIATQAAEIRRLQRQVEKTAQLTHREADAILSALVHKRFYFQSLLDNDEGEVGDSWPYIQGEIVVLNKLVIRFREIVARTFPENPPARGQAHP